eukprot:464454-Ditylum_brightwellii.AAC.1
MSAKDDIKDTPLLFIPGIFGSHLTTKSDGERVYLNSSTALGLRTPDLSLPLTWEDNPPGKQQSPCPLIGAEEDGCLEYVKLCGINIVGIYGPWLDKARAAGRNVIVFSWDWRRQFDE